jgi:hypothetical protein
MDDVSSPDRRGLRRPGAFGRHAYRQAANAPARRQQPQGRVSWSASSSHGSLSLIKSIIQPYIHELEVNMIKIIR